MSYLAHRKDFGPYTDAATTPSASAGRRPGFLQRVFEAMAQSRRRQVDREIAAYLTHTGGRLTDNVEREMMSLMTRTSWRNHL